MVKLWKACTSPSVIWGMEDVSLKLYENDRHELVNESDRELVWKDIYEWAVKTAGKKGSRELRKCSRLKKCTCKMLTAFLTAGLLAGFPAMALSAREAIPAQGQEESWREIPSQRRERSDSYGGTKKLLEKMKEKLDAGELETNEQIREAISQCEEELEITLTEEQKEQLLGLIQKMNALGLNS